MTSIAPMSRHQLFAAFFKMGVSGFGGVLPWARRILVDERGWLSDREFTDLLGLGQALPGPNIVNVAVAVGSRFHGISGAACTVSGLLLAPLAIVLTLAALYEHFGHLDTLRHVLAGVSAAASGLILAMGIKLAQALERSRWTWGLTLAALVGVVVLHLPLPIVLLALAPLGVALASKLRGPQEAKP